MSISSPPDDETEYGYIGISACFTILCIGTVISYTLRILSEKFPIYSKYIKLPTESWLWTVLGLITGFSLQFSSNRALEQVVKIVDDSFASIFFGVLLPPIIFESGYALDVASFRQSFWPALILAGPGTIISALVIGVILYIFGILKGIFSFSFIETLLIGTIASATDTVSVLTTLDEGVVRQDITSLVFGESVLNDAVALVMYRTLSIFQTSTTSITVASIFWGFLTFFTTFIFSSLIGGFVGVIAALIFKHFRLNTLKERGFEEHIDSTPTSPIERSESTRTITLGHIGLADEKDMSSEVERTLYTVIPFLSYFFAESCYQSGVVSALFCGIIMGKTAQLNISSGTRRFAKSFFRLLSSLFEALVFVYIGIAIPQLFSIQMQKYWSTALVLLIACVIGRAAGVYLCISLVNSIERREFEYQRQGVLERFELVNYLSRVVSSIRSLLFNPLSLFQASSSSGSNDNLNQEGEVRINKNSTLFLWWCGLRGGVAFALAQHARQIVSVDAGDSISISVLFVCVVSLICIPPGISPLANWLNLHADSNAKAIQRKIPIENALSTDMPEEQSIILNNNAQGEEKIAEEYHEESKTSEEEIRQPIILPPTHIPHIGNNAAVAARAARAVVSAAAAAVPSRAQIKASLERNLHKAFEYLTIEQH